MRSQKLSDESACMHIPTSATSLARRDRSLRRSRFMNASLEPLSLLLCAPVSTTGAFKFLSMKLSAAAV